MRNKGKNIHTVKKLYVVYVLRFIMPKNAFILMSQELFNFGVLFSLQTVTNWPIS
jgi:hypothetical protein